MNENKNNTNNLNNVNNGIFSSKPLPDAANQHTTLTLRHNAHTLVLVPSLGGAVASWTLAADPNTQRPEFEVWRKWDGIAHPNSPLSNAIASMPLVPWCNRIGNGGFVTHNNGTPTNHYLSPNCPTEELPIHGDGWLQAWQTKGFHVNPQSTTCKLGLTSLHHQGNPFHYEAIHTFTLTDAGLKQTLTVTHLGDAPLPYGLGFHPWLYRNEHTNIQWEHGEVGKAVHIQRLFAQVSSNENGFGMSTLVDDCFPNWQGTAQIDWLDLGLRLTAKLCADTTVNKDKDKDKESRHFNTKLPAFLHIYRPERGNIFCVEPVSHSVNAHHKNPESLTTLHKGDSLSLCIDWVVSIANRSTNELK